MNRTLLLALDTSTEFCSVALAVSCSGFDFCATPHTVHPLSKLFVRHEACGVSSTRLLPAVREVFDEAGCTLHDCSAIAFGAGPGAFTGLRTTTGVVQGLAFALRIPVVPVNTLLACAQAARDRDPAVTRVLAALDARMNKVYWALFEWENTAAAWRIVQTAALAAPESVNATGVFTLAGNAAAVFGAQLAARSRAASIDARALPHAAPIATLGLRSLCAGRVMCATRAFPEYVRDKVALTTVERAALR